MLHPFTTGFQLHAVIQPELSGGNDQNERDSKIELLTLISQKT